MDACKVLPALSFLQNDLEFPSILVSSSRSYFWCIYCGADYNTKPKEHCTESCGPITVPFPFGLEEGCFANEKFHLNCTSGNLTVSVSEGAQYQVTGVSVEDGTLTVSNMVNGSNEKEAILIQTEDGYGVDSPMEDQFDFSVGGCQFNM